MSTEVLAPDILRSEEPPASRFDPMRTAPFVNKSVSEETRRAYRRAVSEFFQFAGMKHPAEVVPAGVLLWRDRRRSQKSAATGALLNPASTKLVSPPLGVLAHDSWPTDAFSPDGKHLVTGSWDGEAIIWDFEVGESRHRMRGHTAKVSKVVYSPSGKVAVLASEDESVCVWVRGDRAGTAGLTRQPAGYANLRLPPYREDVGGG